MSFTYVQATGNLYDANGVRLGTGYSGRGSGLDNPAAENERAVGPIPCGRYRIGPARKPIDHLGPLAMPLDPDPSNEMVGRSGFFIHGDNAALDHSASDGCVILARPLRQLIDDSSDDILDVVPNEADT